MEKLEAKRLSEMPESIFATMTRLAFENNAVNLGQGFPDFDGPDWIMNEAFEAMKKGRNQYAPMPGTNSLRKQICEMQKKYYGIDWDKDKNITVTAGATEAIYSAVNALIDEGDEVIIFEPFYDAYQADVKLAGGVEKYVTLHKPDFSFDFEELEASVSSKTKMIILNNPHNPSGKVFSDEEMAFIAKIAVKNDLLVLSDEVYEFLTFDGIEHKPAASFPGMKDRTVSISSTGKTFSMTGWKIGWAAASERITNAVRKVHQWTAFAVNTPGQLAMASALERLDEYLPCFRDMYQKKRDLILNEMQTTEFVPYQPEGSYFLLAEIPENAKKEGLDFAIELVEKYKVAAIPPSVFYKKSNEGDTMLRLCFAKSDENIRRGIKLLRDYK